MPNIKSAKKRVIVSQEENSINVAKKTRVKNAVKRFNAAMTMKNVEQAEALYNEAVSIIDKAQADGVFHANTAARKVSTIARQLSALKAEIASDAAAVEAARKEAEAKAAAAAKKKLDAAKALGDSDKVKPVKPSRKKADKADKE